MKSVLIVDAFSPAHIGNGVLLKSSIDVIRLAFPDAHIRFLSLEMSTPKLVTDVGYDEFIFRFPVKSRLMRKLGWSIGSAIFILVQIINRASFRVRPSRLCLLRFQRIACQRIEAADIVISITGEAINERTRNTLPFFLFTYWLATALNKEMIIFPQSIGPLTHWWTRALSSMVLSRCRLVVGRDAASMDELTALRIPEEKTYFSPDVGVIQSAIAPAAAESLLDSQGVCRDQRQLIGISVSRPKEHGIAEIDHIEVLLAAIRLQFEPEEVQLLLVPANMPIEGVDEGDLGDCLEFAAALPEYEVRVLEARTYSPDEYKGILALLDLFITSRMHVSILSTMAGTPTITLNTQRKLAGYMMNIGQSNCSVALDRVDASSLANVICATRKNEAEIRRQLRSAAIDMQQKIVEFSRFLSTTLHSS